MNHHQYPGICSIALTALLCATPGLAADQLTPLLGCRTLADSAARLACFDRESAALAASKAEDRSASPATTTPASSAPRAPVTVTAPPPTPAPAATPLDSKKNFGLPEESIAQQEVAAGLRSAELKKIDAHIAAVSVAAGGQATFTLDNGQVWRELLAEGDLLARPGDEATVALGMFHSYSIKLKSGRSAKVTRIS